MTTGSWRGSLGRPAGERTALPLARVLRYRAPRLSRPAATTKAAPMKPYGLAIALAIAIVSPSVARAQATGNTQPTDSDIAIARQLTVTGIEALDRRDYATAEANLARATQLYWAPTIGLHLARARVGLGKLVGAQAAYNRVAIATLPPDASAAFRDAVTDARRELQALTPRVPTLVIRIKGPAAAEVMLDDVLLPPASIGLPRPTDPGEHVIRARAPGFANGEATITLAEGARQGITLELSPGESVPFADSSPSSSGWTTQRTLAIVAAGAGVAGFVVAGIYSAQAISSNNSSTAYCLPGNPNLCYAQGVQDRNDAKSSATVATGAVIAGGVLAAGGVALWFTAPSANGPRTGRLEWSPTAPGANIGLGLRGRW